MAVAREDAAVSRTNGRRRRVGSEAGAADDSRTLLWGHHGVILGRVDETSDGLSSSTHGGRGRGRGHTGDSLSSSSSSSSLPRTPEQSWISMSQTGEKGTRTQRTLNRPVSPEAIRAEGRRIQGDTRCERAIVTSARTTLIFHNITDELHRQCLKVPVSTRMFPRRTGALIRTPLEVATWLALEISGDSYRH